MDLNYIPLIFLITKLNLERHCLLIYLYIYETVCSERRNEAKCITDNMATLIFKQRHAVSMTHSV